jgi:hypothetical protein
MKSVIIMHEKNTAAKKLLAEIGGNVFFVNKEVETLFHWLNSLVPGGGVTTGTHNVRFSGSGIKYETYENGTDLASSLVLGNHSQLRVLAKNCPSLPKAFHTMMEHIATTLLRQQCGVHIPEKNYDRNGKLLFYYKFSTCVTTKHHPQEPFFDTNVDDKHQCHVLFFPFQSSGSFMQVWRNPDRSEDPHGREEGDFIWIPPSRVLAILGSVPKSDVALHPGPLTQHSPRTQEPPCLWIFGCSTITHLYLTEARGEEKTRSFTGK